MQLTILFLCGIIPLVSSQLSSQQLQIFRDNNVTITDDSSEPNKYWIFNHHGIPAHSYGPFPSSDNPNTVSAQNHMFRIPKTPTAASTPGCLTLGDIAVAINGVPLYNPYSGFGYNAVEGSNREIFDNCTGHPQPQGAYHYHTIPECLYTGAVDQLIGVALDGYPIYGPKTTSGAILTSADLDACHGRTTTNGNYEYRLTSDYPYVMGCYRGDVPAKIQSQSGRKRRQAPGGGPPPQGGPPGGLQGGQGQSGGSNSFGPNSCLYVTFCEHPANGCPCSAYTYDANAVRNSSEICNTGSGASSVVNGIEMAGILLIAASVFMLPKY